MKYTYSILRYRLRKSLPALACLLAVALPGFAPHAVQAEPARYEIDPDHLSIGFLVDHIGYARTLGMFRKAEGAFDFDEQTGELSDVKVVVDTASVFSNHKKRDEHLRSADFLNSKEFPEMVFTAESARRTGETTFVIPGQLELLGKTRLADTRGNLEQKCRIPHRRRLAGRKTLRDGGIGAGPHLAQRVRNELRRGQWLGGRRSGTHHRIRGAQAIACSRPNAASAG